jgi:hypothetical protein
MTFTRTYSATFTRTSAKHVASKVAGDLRVMRALYSKPTESQIADYETELLELLDGDYIEKVTYGFKRGGSWIVALRYTADLNGRLTADDRVGKVRAGVDVSGASFYSFLFYSTKWVNLSAIDKAKVRALLPFERGTAGEPGVEGGYWSDDHTYSHSGGGVRRSSLRGWNE